LYKRYRAIAVILSQNFDHKNVTRASFTSLGFVDIMVSNLIQNWWFGHWTSRKCRKAERNKRGGWFTEVN